MEKALMKVTKEIRLGKFLIQEMISSLEKQEILHEIVLILESFLD